MSGVQRHYYKGYGTVYHRLLASRICASNKHAITHKKQETKLRVCFAGSKKFTNKITEEDDDDHEIVLLSLRITSAESHPVQLLATALLPVLA